MTARRTRGRLRRLTYVDRERRRLRNEDRGREPTNPRALAELRRGAAIARVTEQLETAIAARDSRVFFTQRGLYAIKVRRLRRQLAQLEGGNA